MWRSLRFSLKNRQNNSEKQWFQMAKIHQKLIHLMWFHEFFQTTFSSFPFPEIGYASFFKIRQTVESISMISQFHDFLAGFYYLTQLHCARPHHGLNSLKRFTNFLSGSMPLILNWMGLLHQYGSVRVPQSSKSPDALIEVLKFIRNKLYFRSCRKVANSSLSWLVAHFGRAYEGEIWCLCTVTFGQKVPKLNSRPV